MTKFTQLKGALASTIFVTKPLGHHLSKGTLAPTMLNIIGADAPIARKQVKT